MRYLFFILLFVSFSAFGQAPKPLYFVTGNANDTAVDRYNFRVDKTVKLPFYIPANTNYFLRINSLGYLENAIPSGGGGSIFAGWGITKSNDTISVDSLKVATKALVQKKIDSVAGLPSDNIMNSDLTADADHTQDFRTYAQTWNNMSKWYVTDDNNSPLLDLRYTNQFYTTLSNGAYNFTINSDDGYYNFNRLAGSGAAVSTFDANGNLGRFDFDGVSSHYLAGNGTWGTVPSAIDTTSLSNRINLKQNFSDTSTYDATRSWTNTALGSYMKYTDTAGLSSRINTKQNFSDTSTWDATRSWVLGQIPSLTGYQLYSDTSTFDATRAWTNTALGSYMKYTDTVGLSNRINLKLNSSDTASLSNRINLKLNSSDTASLSARINTKQSSTLTSGYLWVGSTGNVATGTPLSGDATISSTGAMTLAASGVTAGSYGSSTAIPTVTVDAKGRITSIGTATVSAGGGTVTSVSAGADITITGTASVNPTVALTAATVYTITETTSFTFNGNNSGIQVITMANANDSVTLTNITEGRQIPYEFIVKRSTASAVLYWNTTVKSAYGGGAQPPQSTPTTCIDRYFITKREGTIYVSYELCDN